MFWFYLKNTLVAQLNNPLDNYKDWNAKAKLNAFCTFSIQIHNISSFSQFFFSSKSLNMSALNWVKRAKKHMCFLKTKIQNFFLINLIAKHQLHTDVHMKGGKTQQRKLSNCQNEFSECTDLICASRNTPMTFCVTFVSFQMVNNIIFI